MGFILVVDDQEENCDMLSRRLNKKGYKTLVANNGVLALEMIEKEEIDLVLLDVRMPGMDGNEVLAKIREKQSPADLPVIMVTAETDSITELKSLGLGANDYVTKPIDFPILLARLINKLQIRSLAKDAIKATKPIFDTIDETRINEIIAEGESQKLEFKSTLRWNIHSGKIGKEIETAWLKTLVAFLNSEGGVLLVGVKDDGSINGLSMDKFKTDDKLLLYVTNSIKDLIGCEYIGLISYDLVPINEDKIIYFKCKATDEAVFLKNGNDEEFYARFGPSSGKLRTKEVLAYMSNKKH